MNWHNTTCERCGEKREIAWVVFSDIIQDRVCDPCGQVALEIRKERPPLNQLYPPYRQVPGAIRVVSFKSERYAQ